jgi:hypothetical protein
LKIYSIRPLPGQEPEPPKNGTPLFDRFNRPIEDDAPLFDRFNRSETTKLLDNPDALPEEKPAAYTLPPRNRSPKPYRGPTGEVVMRRRGGKGFTPIYEPWSSEGLLRARGRFMRAPVVYELAKGTFRGSTTCGYATLRGHSVEWGDYPLGWAGKESDPGPYVLKRAAELALCGGDVSGCNAPHAREFVARTLKANRLANEAPLYMDASVASHRELELEERERFNHEKLWVPGMPMPADSGRRVVTTEYRSEITGEHGAVTRLTPDGRVRFIAGAPKTNQTPVRVQGIKDYTEQARVNGKRIYRQKAVCEEESQARPKAKPGPKPKHGTPLTPAERKALERARKKGQSLPHVIEEFRRRQDANHHLQPGRGRTGRRGRVGKGVAA